MLRLKLLEAGLVAAAVSFSTSYGYADDSSTRDFAARLSGFNEIGSIPTTVTVPAIPSVPSPALTVTTSYTGAILSDGSGTVELKLDKQAGKIDYSLTYSNVGTTAPLTGTVMFAHIHFGKSRDSGGVLVFFCIHPPSAFTGTGPTPPDCPSPSGTVTGTWKAENVQEIKGQNVQAGDFDALVDALESNTAYANVHTTALKGGEIRGQCRSEDREHEGDQGNQ
jgi:hypothetical protein